MRTFTGIITLTFLTATVYSQAVHKGIQDDPIVKERLANNGQRIKADLKVSEYFGLEDQLKAILLGNTIPVECPKSTNGYTSKTEYVKAVNNWLTENRGLKRQDKQEALITE